ncbi:MAG: imidazole glycerol phosphate synthase subunit HisF [Sphingobacteriales bacterium 50-39]|nr:imidazole glycerol phosphate synthase subunit HisF [Sphingobacteriales bacterium]OJW56841.1 MAG: imidazole glycerol phosphate synthase subunit HisF [Sphingobacteriales bacterium 50-39]
MKRVRVIPALLIQKGGLVKSIRFKDHKYVGDPINAVKIFNEKEVDEIVILDISATAENRPPNITQIKEIAGEAFMPLAYGGGITKLEEIKELISAGVEKVVLNTTAFINPQLVSEGARYIGSQSMVVSIDVKKNIWGKYKVFVQNGSKSTGIDPVTFARQMEEAGAGELILNSIERDGTFEGYDTEMIQSVSKSVNIPVVAIGGASTVDDFARAVQHGASAVAAGSMFVFQRPHRAVLISYPSQPDLKEKLYSLI